MSTLPDMALTDKAFIGYKDIMGILGVSRHTAYEIIHSLPHIGGEGVPLRVRKEIFEKYISDKENVSSVMKPLAKNKFVTVNGNKFYIREQRGRRMVLQLVNI
jgi:Mn-dependent DtxR family transcriptional regulator